MNKKTCMHKPACHFPIFAKGYCKFHQHERTDYKPNRIKPISDKLKGKLNEYRKVRKEYLAENPVCEAKLKGCTYQSTEIHHKAKRGKNLSNKETFMAICRNCHNSTHFTPKDKQ